MLHDGETADNTAAGTVVTAMFQGSSVLIGVETKPAGVVSAVSRDRSR